VERGSEYQQEGVLLSLPLFYYYPEVFQILGSSLDLAVKNGEGDAWTLLHAAINEGDMDGCTPLHRAVENHAFEAAE
jgi:hypothetical protein